MIHLPGTPVDFSPNWFRKSTGFIKTERYQRSNLVFMTVNCSVKNWNLDKHIINTVNHVIVAVRRTKDLLMISGVRQPIPYQLVELH